MCGFAAAGGCVRKPIKSARLWAILWKRKTAEAGSAVFPPFGRGKQSACPTLSDLALPENRRVCGQKPTPTFTKCIRK